MRKVCRYIDVAPLHRWRDVVRHPNLIGFLGPVYLFRNRPGIRPGRWGFGLCGLVEIGSRNPDDPVGVWLKKRGLWPW